MKKLVIELCCVIALAACGNGKEQKTVEEDAMAKALLQGVWINDETELPLMRIEGDTIYYADPQNIPVSFKNYTRYDVCVRQSYRDLQD